MAFFSSTDLKDEVSTRFFGVIGKIDSDVPEMAIRAASGGNTIPVEIEDVFDMEVMKLKEDSNYQLDASVLNNITERKFTTNLKGKAYPGIYDYDYDDGWGDDWQSYNGTTNTYKRTSTQPYSQRKKKYSDSLQYNANPYSKIYGLISTARYGVIFKEETARSLLTCAIDCVKTYYKDHEKTEYQLDELLIEFSNELASFEISDIQDYNTGSLVIMDDGSKSNDTQLLLPAGMQ